MNYWLVKTEPNTYSWDNLVKEKTGVWDGVRNFQARSNIKAMKKGDTVFVYHTGEEKTIVGVAKVAREAYPEPKDNAWVAVDLTADKKLKRSISLAQVKADKKLSNMVLVRASRLSVQPVREEEYKYILALSQE
jgi:predicted RNA-binding protein with PUA-like domain